MAAITTMTQADEFSIIDCDAHLTEPPDLWVSRAPGSWKDRVPVQKTVDGETHWFLDDRPWASTGGNTVITGRDKVLGAYKIHPFDRIDPSAWAVKERLEVMDSMNIIAQVLYPNGIGFSSNHVFAIDDAEQREVVLRTYNDFLVEVQEDSGGRLLPQGLLPIWDMNLTVREMTRLIDRGMTGFTLSDKPELLGLPELDQPYFNPMWDLFNESGAVGAFHIASGRRRDDTEAVHTRGGRAAQGQTRGAPQITQPAWSSFGPQRAMMVYASQMYMSNVRIVVNLCMSNLFDRFPKLKIASAESGIGWVPFVLEAMEYQVDEMVVDPGEAKFQQRRPTDYFRDHIYVMFWFERSAPAKLLEDIGLSNVLVETDFPHPTCLYPGSQEHFKRALAGLDPYARRRILRENAAELYRVPITRAP
jgi:uncharacterized protein